MYNKAGFYKKAEEILDKAKQSMEDSKSTDNNDWSSILYQLADVKSTMKKTAEAATAYNAAVSYAQKDTALFYQYIMYATLFAEFLMDNKMFKRADSLYSEIARQCFPL
jgi:hypothetical protein